MRTTKNALSLENAKFVFAVFQFFRWNLHLLAFQHRTQAAFSLPKLHGEDRKSVGDVSGHKCAGCLILYIDVSAAARADATHHWNTDAYCESSQHAMPSPPPRHLPARNSLQAGVPQFRAERLRICQKNNWKMSKRDTATKVLPLQFRLTLLIPFVDEARVDQTLSSFLFLSSSNPFPLPWIATGPQKKRKKSLDYH